MLNQSEAHMQIAQAVQAMWKEVLNVNVNIEQQEWGVYLETLKPDSPDADKPEIFRMGWCADYMDANNYLADVLDSKSTQNYSRYNNPEFDALVEKAQVESDPAVRADLYRQAEVLLNNVDTAVAPIYFYTRDVLSKPYLARIVNPLHMDHVYKWKLDGRPSRLLGRLIAGQRSWNRWGGSGRPTCRLRPPSAATRSARGAAGAWPPRTDARALRGEAKRPEP